MGSTFTWLGTTALAIALAGASGAHAAVIYGTAGVAYTQDFNGLPLAIDGSLAGNWNSGEDGEFWVQNSTIEGWYYRNGGSINGNFGVSNGRYLDQTNARTLTSGGNATNRVLSLANSADTNNTSLGMSQANSAFGLRLTNDTGTTLTQFTLSYTGQQWARYSAGSGGLSFYYLVTDNNDDPTSFGTGGETSANPLNVFTNGTAVAELGFTAPQTTLSNANLDGTQAANQVAVSHAVSGINWQSGTDMYLVWQNWDGISALAIEDLSFTAVPEPASMALLTGLGGLALLRRRNR